MQMMARRMTDHLSGEPRVSMKGKTRCRKTHLQLSLVLLIAMAQVAAGDNDDDVPFCKDGRQDASQDEFGTGAQRRETSRTAASSEWSFHDAVDAGNVSYNHSVHVTNSAEFIEALSNVGSSTLLTLDAGLFVLPGVDVAPAAFWLRDVEQLTIAGQCLSADAGGGCLQPATVLSCNPPDATAGGAGLAFFGVADVTLANVTVLGCGALHWSTSWSNMTGQLPITAALLFAESRGVALRGVTVQRSAGAGVFLVDVAGRVSVTACTFLENNATDMLPYMNAALDNETSQFGGGGLLVEFTFCPLPVLVNASDITGANSSLFFPECDPEAHALWVRNRTRPHYAISNNTFSHNRGRSYDIRQFTFIRPGGHFHQAFGRGAGLSVFFKGSVRGAHVAISDCRFYGNEAAWGAGLFLELQDSVAHTNVTVERCRLQDNLAGQAGGGVRLGFIFLDPDITNDHNSIRLDSVDIIGNRAAWGGGVAAYTASEPTLVATNTLEFVACAWWRNSAHNAAAVALNRWHYITPGGIAVPTFHDCRFVANAINKTASFVGRGAVLVDMLSLVLRSTHFCHNTGSALVLDTSSVTMVGDILFYNNTGDTGGAVMLTGFSWITLRRQVTLLFRRNRAAMYGGALYCQTNSAHSVLSSRNCFLQYEDPVAPPKLWNATLTFAENEAGAAGHSIYATTLFHCLWGGSIEGNVPDGEQMRRVMNWTNFHYESAGLAGPEISTTANTILVPAGSVQMAPGERTKVRVEALDDLKQPVDTVVYVTVEAGDGGNVTVGEDSYRTIGDGGMSDIWLLGEAAQNRSLRLRTLTAIPVSQQLAVELVKCRPCYTYSPEQRQCLCMTDTKLSDSTAVSRCDDTDYSCYLQNGFWGGYIRRRRADGGAGDGERGKRGGFSEPDELMFRTAPCPFDYCRCSRGNNATYSECTLLASPELDTTDASGDEFLNRQCMENRMGRLCGRCRPGFSVRLGSNECWNCTSESVYTIWGTFSVIGVLITLCMIWVDFNILSGHVNSSWFYFQVLPYILSDNASYKFTTVMPFSVVMNLVNASLPWATCFVIDLDDLRKIGLSYAVPAYILAIVLVIAVICRYPRVRYVLLLGCVQKKEPSVLKTLCSLLAIFYVSLVANSFQLLAFTYIGGTGPWFYRDANVEWWGAQHAPWGAVAVLIVVVVAIPVPLFLLCGPCLQRRLTLARFKPLLDNVQAPYAHNRRSFAGFYFAVRLVILAITTTEVIPQHIRQVVLQLLCLVVLVVHMCAQPYSGRFVWLNYVDTVILAVLAATIQVNFFYGVRSDSGETTYWAAYVIQVLMSIPLFYIGLVMVAWLALTVLAKAKDVGLIKRQVPTFQRLEQLLSNATVGMSPHVLPESLPYSDDDEAAQILWTASSAGRGHNERTHLLHPPPDSDDDDDDDDREKSGGGRHRSYSSLTEREPARERRTDSSRGYVSSSTVDSVASRRMVGDDFSSHSVQQRAGRRDSGHG